MSDEFIEFIDENGAGDSVQFIARDALHISMDNPWAGDTESGFGATTSVTLNTEQVAKLCAFLTAWLNA